MPNNEYSRKLVGTHSNWGNQFGIGPDALNMSVFSYNSSQAMRGIRMDNAVHGTGRIRAFPDGFEVTGASKFGEKALWDPETGLG